ncbi:hypothetical protein GLOTRDRAFT_109965 [Gloeophyllum trabeum ATCC 11539]|uniref:Uncharacterized protein n=1 Tax=Gloeophyllum trabeum (strain ATCC 11539 / FP-39264 / Madison 617) TaxID=670483 RepID=S7QF64_GLOTA|nr:uncharacterized protein GLOTRDRAFT_109965 [Gloeophyllum trabeum ATCC 11539]EPQ57968.1 hypothetical protein GLOTRDRAFT_109965 [Gloeophyllum trabeum ATCC 11539]
MTGPASDVPALIPSALGRALASRGAGNRTSFTSVSSNWSSSAFTEDDDDDFGSSAVYGVDEEYGYLADVPLDPMDGTTTKSSTASPLPLAGLTKSMPSSALAYARRPSTTNNRSTIPHLHRRISSSSSSSFSQSSLIAKSAPSSAPYPSDDDLSFSDSPAERQPTIRRSQKPKQREDPDEGTAKPKSKRNRASLPSYFALLQTGSSPAARISDESSKYSCSSIHTLTGMRTTPPTPTSRRLPNSAEFDDAANFRGRSAVEATPRRGRPKERFSDDDDSSVSRRATLSRSPSRASRSRSSRQHTILALDQHEAEKEGRGRVSTKREFGLITDEMAKLAVGFGRGTERSESEGRRGRLRPEELDDGGMRMKRAPGLGSGRSGLRDRERWAMRGLAAVP